MNGDNLSLTDLARPVGRTEHCDGCEHAAGWTTLTHAARTGLDASATAELLDALGIDPTTLKEAR